MKDYKLYPEEQEILDWFENPATEHVSSLSADEDKKIAKTAAKNFTQKTERINIRLTPYDLSHIKRIAAKEGIPYQTLISSILHKYTAGHFQRL